MPIDRIGKGGPPVEPPKTTESGRPTAPERPFEVRAEKTASAPPAAEITSASAPLERLRAGQIDLNGYLELRVREATLHLDGVPAAKLDTIKKVLRDQLRTDPALIELVRQATGSVPTPSDD